MPMSIAFVTHQFHRWNTYQKVGHLSAPSNHWIVMSAWLAFT